MNIMDYLTWRGDLTFAQSEFCEVDNMLLCYLVYVNLDGIAPGIGQGIKTVADLSEAFFERYSQEELEKDRSLIRLAPYVMQAMAESCRFSQVLVQNYVNQVDTVRMMQFAAMELLLPDGTIFVAYRGTDDTIVGWKEDFYLSKGEVPSEKEAIAYLNRAGRTYPTESEIKRLEAFPSGRWIRVGGHSKGGNLAIYAATYCNPEIQKQILEIYNNDGPGFTREFLDMPQLENIRERIVRIIPECSIIGMLLEHVVEPVVIESSQKLILQHDGMSWEVRGPRFVRKPELSHAAVAIKRIIDEWLAGLKDDVRDQIIDDLFSVLEATKALTLTELQEGGLRNIKIMMREVENMDSESKEALQMLFKNILQNIPKFFGK